MLDGARALCGDPALAEDVARFLTDHPLRSGQRSVAQMLERLAVNVAFGDRQRTRLGAVLADVAGDTGLSRRHDGRWPARTVDGVIGGTGAAAAVMPDR